MIYERERERERGRGERKWECEDDGPLVFVK